MGITGSLLVALAVSAPIQAQYICRPGTTCSCSAETVFPNLKLVQTAHFSGKLLDTTGAPITFEKTIIQVRDPKTSKVLASAMLDQNGRFDLGQIPQSEYRFIAAWQQADRLKRLPLFDQPTAVSCPADALCEVNIVLKLHPTDQLFEFCPPK